MCNAIQLLFIVDGHVAVFIIALPHTNTSRVTLYPNILLKMYDTLLFKPL